MKVDERGNYYHDDCAEVQEGMSNTPLDDVTELPSDAPECVVCGVVINEDEEEITDDEITSAENEELEVPED